MISLENLCIYYFENFNKMNTVKLQPLFAEDIELEDWNIKVKGIYQVTNEIIDIFNSVKSIEVYPIKLHECGDTVCCEIKIQIDDNNPIQVMDVITFDNMMKIKKIKAYKI